MCFHAVILQGESAATADDTRDPKEDAGAGPSKYKDIFEACEKGTAEDVLHFLKVASPESSRGPGEEVVFDCNIRDGQGRTPLCIATSKGKYEVAELLLDSKADVNWQDSEGRTPLFHAAKEEDYRLLRILKGSGGDLSLVDNRGRTPLWVVACSGDLFLSHLIVGMGGDIDHPFTKSDQLPTDDPAFYTALLENEVVGARILLQLGADAWVLEDRKFSKILRILQIMPVLVDQNLFAGAVQAMSVVAALIATITYVGWLNPPGVFSAGMSMLENGACMALSEPSNSGSGSFNMTTFSFDFGMFSTASTGSEGDDLCARYHSSLLAYFILNSLAFYFSMLAVIASLLVAIPLGVKPFYDQMVQNRWKLLVVGTLLFFALVFALLAFAFAGFAVIPGRYSDATRSIAYVCLGAVPVLPFVIFFGLDVANFIISEVSTFWSFVVINLTIFGLNTSNYILSCLRDRRSI